MKKNNIEELKILYPLERLELEFSKIEKLGYTVEANESGCQVFEGKDFLIDADFYEDYHSNAASAIFCFWNELGY